MLRLLIFPYFLFFVEIAFTIIFEFLFDWIPGDSIFQEMLHKRFTAGTILLVDLGKADNTDILLTFFLTDQYVTVK